MANIKKDKQKLRKIGNTTVQNQKKPLIDPRYKNFVSTLVVVIILLVFFIINNTRDEPEQGPYPPYYKKDLQLP